MVQLIRLPLPPLLPRLSDPHPRDLYSLAAGEIARSTVALAKPARMISTSNQASVDSCRGSGFDRKSVASVLHGIKRNG
jgi:hypothetical protein